MLGGHIIIEDNTALGTAQAEHTIMLGGHIIT